MHLLIVIRGIRCHDRKIKRPEHLNKVSPFFCYRVLSFSITVQLSAPFRDPSSSGSNADALQRSHSQASSSLMLSMSSSDNRPVDFNITASLWLAMNQPS